MNWQEVEESGIKGLKVWFTNDRPITDFSISDYQGKCKIALHTQTRRDGEFLGVVFKTVQEAKDYVEEINRYENFPINSKLLDLIRSLDASAHASM